MGGPTETSELWAGGDARTTDLPAPAARPDSRAPTGDAGPPEQAAAPLPGTFGRYVLRRELGRGGVGVVYEAFDPQLERVVALKTLIAGRGATDTQLERFVREVRASAHLRHPNIVSVHDAGTIEGRQFLTMDAIAGQSLDHLIAALAPAPREVVELLVPIARALEYAHAQGIVHRDVKPENILVDHAGRPYLTDFGLARDLALPRLTRTDATVGTPAFMPPEQLRSAPPDPRMDIYALGATLYECLTGRVPFSGDSLPELMRRVLQDDPPSPRTLNPRIAPDLEAIVLQCLEKDPARRFSSADALAQDLERFLRGEAVQARPPSAARRLARRVLRHGAALVGGVIATTGIVLGAGFALSVRRDAAAEAVRVAKLEEERARLLESRRVAETRVTREEALRAAVAEAALVTTLEGQALAWDRVVREWPDAWDVRLARARVLRALCHERRARGQDLPGARAAARRALEDLDVAVEATSGSPAAAAVLLLRAELLRHDLRDGAAARAGYARLSGTQGPLGDYARARLALLAGDLEAAHTSAASALAARADLDPARVLLAEVLLARGAPDQAMVHLDRAAAGPSAGAEPVRLLGEALLALGDPVGAQRVALRAIELDPEDPRAHLLLGRVRLDAREPVRALASLDRACALAPTDPAPRALAALAAEQAGDPRLARRYAEEARALAAGVAPVTTVTPGR